MYLQYHIMLISSEETEEEEVGIYQVSPVVEDVVEDVVAEEELYLDMDELKEEDLDMYEVDV